MRKIIFAAAWGLTTAAFALEAGVGAFYSPARVVGYVDETRDLGKKEFSPAGFKGRVSVGVYESLNVNLGFGYNDFVYREEPITFPETPHVISIPMFITTVGADYGLRFGPLRPFAGGGAAVARESAEAYGYSTTDWYGGLYVEGGARYFVVGALAVEAGPRYTYLFDEPVVYFDGLHTWDFVRSEDRSRLLELLVGFNYYF
jgi:hypothetical protein